MMGSCQARFIVGNFAARLFDFYMFQNCWFHKMRRALFLLAAVNPENWLQVKVLDNTFNILNFRSMNPG